ncbi:hypothetical protein HDV01_004746 [Terramyces sp. JEL0728]|nr:hypothetical protein HDV01_004746 [Terramyces sp. JEL0728]
MKSKGKNIRNTNRNSFANSANIIPKGRILATPKLPSRKPIYPSPTVTEGAIEGKAAVATGVHSLHPNIDAVVVNNLNLRLIAANASGDQSATNCVFDEYCAWLVDDPRLFRMK